MICCCASASCLRSARRSWMPCCISSADDAVRERLRARYKYILVDEFQDTNIAQLELLWQLGGKRPNLVVVGDHRQAIYRFRGASFGSFTIFLEKFAKDKGAAARRIAAAAHTELPLLRSHPARGRTGNQPQRKADQYSRVSARGRFKEDGEKVRIVTHATSEAEAQWVAAELARLHKAGAKWRTFAVLYRGHSHRDKLVDVLKARKIPFVIKNLSILSHRLVRDLIAYLRLIDHPLDDVACARVLAMPAWGLEPADLVRLSERAAKSKGSSLWDTMQAAKNEPPFSTGGRDLDTLVELVTGTAKESALRDSLGIIRSAGRRTSSEHCGGRRRPQIFRSPGPIYSRVGAEERNAAAERICGVPGLFRAGRRLHQSGAGIRRRRAADDRARGERSGVRSRVRFARGASRLSRRRKTARAGISSRVDEGRAAAGKFPYSGGAPPVLCGGNTRAAKAHAEHGGKQALETFAISGRHFDGRADQAPRRGATRSYRRQVRQSRPAKTRNRRCSPRSRAARALVRKLANGPRRTARLFRNLWR